MVSMMDPYRQSHSDWNNDHSLLLQQNRKRLSVRKLHTCGLFIWGLFNGAASSSSYKTPKSCDMVNNECKGI
jgi:hypothetical protein